MEEQNKISLSHGSGYQNGTPVQFIDNMEATFSYSKKKIKWYLNWKFPFLHKMTIIEDAEIVSVSLPDGELKKILPNQKYTLTFK